MLMILYDSFLSRTRPKKTTSSLSSSSAQYILSGGKGGSLYFLVKSFTGINTQTKIRWRLPYLSYGKLNPVPDCLPHQISRHPHRQSPCITRFPISLAVQSSQSSIREEHCVEFPLFTSLVMSKRRVDCSPT